MRYWRHYPKFLQTILLMLMIFTMTSFAQVLANFGVTKIYGEQLDKIYGLANHNQIQARQFVQAIVSIFRFTLCALLFAYLTHPAPMEYLGIRKFKNNKFPLIIIPLMIAGVIIFAQIGEWLQLIDFGKGAKANFEEQQRVLKTMMQGTAASDLILYLFLFALLPALGEELLFRGIVMRFAYGSSRNIHFAVLFSAAIFSMAHNSIYQFLPIMLAGILLGYLYYFSGSIWSSIIAHFINNSMGVLMMFLGNKQIISEEASQAASLPWYVLIASLLIFIFAFLLLRKNATPLAADWNDDFNGEAQTQ